MYVKSLRFRCLTSKVGVFILLLCVTGISVFWRAEIQSYFPPQEERSCACDRCLLEDEPSFVQRLSKNEPPFLSQNHNLSESHFNWWRRLRPNNTDFSSYNEVMKEMFQMFPKTPEVEAASPARCRTCSVVGNSINLRRSHYGPLIDLQDYVIRMNRAQIKGFEADVGKRTTHHIMYPGSSKDLDNTTRLVLFAFKILDLQWLKDVLNTSVPYKERRLKANADLRLRSNKPTFSSYIEVVKEIFQKFPKTPEHDPPSPDRCRTCAVVGNSANLNGSHYGPLIDFQDFVISSYANFNSPYRRRGRTFNTDLVHLFGFGADSEGQWRHYWEELRNKQFKTGVHAGNVEFAMIKELSQNQIIKYYGGW
ncbi:CMP-N-acetylneuraminate-beta-galactosamide-alpha-2,3-sialyltransferase 1 [Liparis tanakae]|uniref:CMP-N-acetylneuraminate-beta-galactosamide-alpha-2,3-sialyltransferase 1 n=1 Tax=Liparis tanakae TaxID=230148 RepID=A0A4Z2FCN9_9TELE|nr:CMP-N-acetylneuraminate-beta-galactosamide-alpha-2,3-sialyltransferase 1 [Liparis tanakae]